MHMWQRSDSEISPHPTNHPSKLPVVAVAVAVAVAAVVVGVWKTSTPEDPVAGM